MLCAGGVKFKGIRKSSENQQRCDLDIRVLYKLCVCHVWDMAEVDVAVQLIEFKKCMTCLCKLCIHNIIWMC